MTATAPITVVSGSGNGVRSGLLLALGSALAFSSSGPVMKPLLEAGWSVGAALLVRIGVSSLILLPVLVVAVIRRPGLISRYGLVMAGFGITGIAGAQTFFFLAIQRMPVAVALLIEYLAPVLLVVLTWARTRRVPSRVVLAGSVAAVAGLVLVVDVAGAQFDLLGVVLAIGAAVCLAAYFLIAARCGPDLPPLALASGGLLTGTAIIAGLCLIGVLPFAAPLVSVALAGVEVAWFVALAWVVVVSTTIAYASGVMATARIGSRLASFVGLSEVLFALGFAWLLLGESPAPIQLLGGALILAGVVLVKMDTSSDPVLASSDIARRPGAQAP